MSALEMSTERLDLSLDLDNSFYFMVFDKEKEMRSVLSKEES